MPGDPVTHPAAGDARYATAAPTAYLRLGVASLRPQDTPGAGPHTLMAQAHAALGQDQSR